MSLIRFLPDYVPIEYEFSIWDGTKEIGVTKVTYWNGAVEIPAQSFERAP